MDTHKSGLSIKYKLLVLLVVLPTVMLALYLALATNIFKSDKIAYVYDSSSDVSKALSAQARGEINSKISKIKSIWSYKGISSQIFQNSDDILYFALFTLNDKNLTKVQELSKLENKGTSPDRLSMDLINSAKVSGSSLVRLSTKTNLFFLALKVADNTYLTSIFNASSIIQVFDRPSKYSSFLIGAQGEVIAGPEFEKQRIMSFSNWKFFKKINKNQSPSMTLEIESPKSHKKILLAYSKLGTEGLSVVSLTDKNTALDAVRILLSKSLLFFIALISAAIIISVFASRQFTRPIRDLYKATKIVAEGNLDIVIPVTTNDEIGSLARSFNNMTVDLRGAQEKLQDYAKNLEIKVADRTKELAEKNQNLDAMVNSLGQGFLLFDHEGKCAPLFSKACVKILETDPADKNIWDVLKIQPEKATDFKNWCVMLFQDMLPFNDMIQIAPKTFTHSENRHVVLDYFPVRNEEQKLSAVVLVATDKTEEAEANKLAKREAASAKRVMRITKNREQFKTFIQEALKTFEQVKKQLMSPNPGPSNIEVMFQLIHTLKGDSGTFMLDFTFERAHAFEGIIQDLKRATEEKIKEAIPGLINDLAAMKDEFEKFLAENRELIGDTSKEAKTVDISFSSLTSFFKNLKADNKYTEVAVDFQNEFLKEPIQKFFTHFNDLAADVAQRKDKQIKPIVFKGGDLRVEAAPYTELFSTFVHAVRNTIDHGIESPDDRTDIAKDPAGSITLEFTKREDNSKPWIDIVFKDDGRGIDPKIIREKLRKNGYANADTEDDETIIQHVFDSGFSTRDVANELSGRGIGMGAIKSAAESLGGSAVMKSEIGKGAMLKVTVPEVSEQASESSLKSA